MSAAAQPAAGQPTAASTPPASRNPFSLLGRKLISIREDSIVDSAEKAPPLEFVAPALPRISQSLISLYGLQDTAASVARYNPVTGLKTSLRSSYTGFPTKLGLAGRNKGVNVYANEGPTQEPLKVLLNYEKGLIQSRWEHAPLERGLDVLNRGSDTAERKLARAFLLDPNHKIPSHMEREWGMALGHEQKAPKTKQQGLAKANGLTKAPASASAGPVARVASPKPSTPAINRPQRKTAGQKRMYDDEVREGEHGYYDEASDGASTDGGSQRKKRKSSAQDLAGPTATMYGPGMIHR